MAEFLQEDKVKSEMTFREMLVKMWPYMRRHKGIIVSVLVLVVAYTLVGRLMPILFGYAIDEGIEKKNLNLVYWIAGGYFALDTIRSLLGFGKTTLSAKFGNRVLFEIRERVVDHVQRLPAVYFDKNPVGRTVTRVTNDVVSLGELFNQGFTVIFVNIIELVSIIVALCFISVRMTLAAVIVAPILVFLAMVISRRIRALFRESKKKLAAINAYSAESLNGIKVIQLYNREGHRRDNFQKLSQEYRTLQLGTVRLFAMLWPIFHFFNIFTVCTALLLGGIYYREMGLTIGQLSAFVLLIQSFFPPIRTILERYNQFQNSLASADRIFALLAEREENLDGQPLPEKRLTGKIEIKNLSFRYSENADWALKNVSLTVEPGESVALVGRTGSGKSTTIGLLQKLYLFEEGDILVDGISLHQIAPRSLRSRIGVVQQDNFIFRGTLRSNITMAREDISEERIMMAARMANCTRLIEGLPGGLDAKVEERGANLSVGEKQLLAFARVLAHDPDILVLDEATANIDSQNEELIQKATLVATRGRTSVIIAHRLSTILHCDKIVVLEKGQIIEQGRHHELLALGGKYYQLYQSQFREENEGAAADTSVREYAPGAE